MLDVYKASAGSGKTFALTREYFKLIFEVPTDYKNILAVTFTNKATEEMKSRIINELFKLAQGEASDYGELLKQEFGFSDEQLKNKAKALMTMLLHDYGRLAVTTIDRFFQRLIKAFTKELGIFPGYNVELDSDFVLLKAVDKMMQQVKNDAVLRSWISELMSSNVDEGKSWSVKSKITDLGEELFKENYMLFDKNILDKFSDKNFLKDYRAFLNKIIGEFEGKLTTIGEQACGLIRENGLELSDFKGNKTGCTAYFYKLAAGNFEEPTATARKGIDTPDAWATKTSPLKGKIDCLVPELNRLLREAIRFYDDTFYFYNSAIQLSGNLYQLGILNDLYKEVRGYCNDKGLMLLSDTTHILNKLIGDNDTPFLYEKVGNYYKHLMIDEFQDTSSMQYKNFRPLLANSLSQGNRAIIVGDVKQSIYRWRNGDWSLLAQGVERDFNAFGIRNIVLESNWRSAQEVVKFNNVFFEKGAFLLKQLYDREQTDETSLSTAISNAYQDVRQIPQKQKNGYVEIVFGPEKKEKDSDTLLMDNLIPVILDITDRGGKLKDIVVLVRGGKEGAFVADYLMEYNKQAEKAIPFISNDSLYVWASPYVQFIVAVLKYILQPYDKVNKATILYFYYTFIREDKEAEADRIFKATQENEVFEFLNIPFTEESGKIMSYSLYETTETIIDRFSLRTKQEGIPYLIAFQDIVYEYEAGNSNSITLFLEWWEKEKGKRVLTTSEEVDALKILTIHKSKGLEFEYVILPFCNWELDSVRPVRRIWCSNDMPGFKDLEYAPLNYSSKLAQTIFKEDYRDEHLTSFVDNLILLFVGLPGAITELYLRPFMPKFNKDGSLPVPDIGAFIYYVLSGLKQENTDCFSVGDDMSLRFGQKQRHAKQTGGQHVLGLEQYPVFQPEDRIRIKYRYRDYIEPGKFSHTAIDEGRLLHEIFKSVVSIEDVRAAIEQACLTGLIPGAEKEEYYTKMMGYLDFPEVAAWFRPQNKVINERDILSPAGRKARPDRVVVYDGIVRVIDYKFGLNEENKYLKQVKFYCSTLQEMGYEPIEGYVWYVKLGKVVRI